MKLPHRVLTKFTVICLKQKSMGNLPPKLNQPFMALMHQRCHEGKAEISPLGLGVFHVLCVMGRGTGAAVLGSLGVGWSTPPSPSHQSLYEHNLLLLLFLCIFSACFLHSKHKQQGRLLGPSMDGTRPPITWIKSLPTPGWFGIIPPAPLTEKGQANLLPWAWQTAQKYHQRPTNLPEQINGNDRKANKQTNTLPNRFILIFFCLENKCG